MPTLSPVIATLRQPFTPLFQARTWAQALRAPGRRTVSTALQSLGLHPERNFAVYHQVLHRA